MSMGSHFIRAGRYDEIFSGVGEWLLVDVGFSPTDHGSGKTCGILKADKNALELKGKEAHRVTFSDLQEETIRESQLPWSGPLNLVLETPLSVAFDSQGNPTPRFCDLPHARASGKFCMCKESENNCSVCHCKNDRRRPWYAGAAPDMTMACAYLLRKLEKCGIQREVRLFEGFVSFKSSEETTDHIKDVKRLRKIVQHKVKSRIFDTKAVKSRNEYRLLSAFEVFGMYFGIPPVIRTKTCTCSGQIQPSAE